MAVTLFPFGKCLDGTEVTAAEIRHANGLSAVILDYGATVQALCVPNINGVPVDVVLGYDTVQEYEKNGRTADAPSQGTAADGRFTAAFYAADDAADRVDYL